jgi:hypothetical protein
MGSRKKSVPGERQRLSAAITKGYERYLKIALALPGAQASTSYGTPSVKIRGKLLSRWRSEAEGALAIRCDFLDRQILLQTQPEVFFLTDHYLDYPMVLVRLDKVSRDVLVDAAERAWRLVAPAMPSQESADPPRSRDYPGRGRRLLRPPRSPVETAPGLAGWVAVTVYRRCNWQGCFESYFWARRPRHSSMPSARRAGSSSAAVTASVRS